MNPSISIPSFKPGLIVVILIIAVFAFCKWKVGNATDLVKPVVLTEVAYKRSIYCGVSTDDRYFDLASEGIAKPLGGPGSLVNLINGDRNCNFILWTYDAYAAYLDATETLYGNRTGWLLKKLLDTSKENTFIDGSTIIGGNKNIVFIRGMAKGCIPIKVEPGLDRATFYATYIYI